LVEPLTRTYLVWQHSFQPEKRSFFAAEGSSLSRTAKQNELLSVDGVERHDRLHLVETAMRPDAKTFQRKLQAYAALATHRGVFRSSLPRMLVLIGTRFFVRELAMILDVTLPSAFAWLDEDDEMVRPRTDLTA
jgi:hypothetical protein